MRINLRSKTQIVLLLIIGLTISFIFSNSALNLEESLKQSDEFEESLNNIFTPPIENPPIDDTIDVTPPAADTPEEDTPSQMPPEADTPEEDTPSQMPPEADAPEEDTPGDTPPVTDTPVEDTPGDTPPVTDTPEEEPPLENEPSDDSADEEEIPRRESPFLEAIRPHIRKIAHFLEHGVLGLEVFFLCLSMQKYSGKKRKIMPIGIKTIFSSINFGLIIALIDESIQILSERGPSITDMWIDISGYASFTLLLVIIYVIVNIIKAIINFVSRPFKHT